MTEQELFKIIDQFTKKRTLLGKDLDRFLKMKKF